MSHIYKGQPVPGHKAALLNYLRDTFGKVAGLRNVQPRSLRAYGKVKNNDPSIKMDFQDKRSVLSSESLLQDDRFFFFNTLSIGIALVPAVINASGEGSEFKPGNRRVVTYPYYSVFAPYTSTAAGTAAGLVVPNPMVYECIRNLYNGHFTFKVDQYEYLEGTPLSKFMICPHNRPEVVHYGHHQVELGLPLNLQGGKEQLLNIKLADDSDYSAVASIENRFKIFVEVEMEGFEIICPDKSIFTQISKMINEVSI